MVFEASTGHHRFLYGFFGMEYLGFEELYKHLGFLERLRFQRMSRAGFVLLRLQILYCSSAVTCIWF